MSKGSRARRSEVSEVTTRRLSIYSRCLDALLASGVETVSSADLAERFDLSPARFRKDLARFGEFGVRGLGYRVADLKQQIAGILGTDRQVRLAVVGAGPLGMALAADRSFARPGCLVAAVFDHEGEHVGQRTEGGLEVAPLSELAPFRARAGIDVAVLAVPPEAGQQAVDAVAAAGIRAALSFVPFGRAPLAVPAGLHVQTIDFKAQVESLMFHLLSHSEHEVNDGPIPDRNEACRA